MPKNKKSQHRQLQRQMERARAHKIAKREMTKPPPGKLDVQLLNGPWRRG